MKQIKSNKGMLIGVVLAIIFSMYSTVFAAAVPSEDVVTIAAVNFNATWGNKIQNLRRIEGYITAAAKQGANIVIFPETALTGYDVKDDKVEMQKENAETIPGPATNEIAKITAQYGIYVVLGMPERDIQNPDVIYNSAAVIGPQGVIGSSRKIQPFNMELKWATKGSKPFLFETPWGPVGVGICYDTYSFPEIARYYTAMGARLYINPTATGGWYRSYGSIGRSEWEKYYGGRLEARAGENNIFMASANLVGKDLTSIFPGGSIILGPSLSKFMQYYAGSLALDEEQLIIATIDLSKASRSTFKENSLNKTPDWRLKIYEELLKDVREKTDLGQYQ